MTFLAQRCPFTFGKALALATLAYSCAIGEIVLWSWHPNIRRNLTERLVAVQRNHSSVVRHQSNFDSASTEDGQKWQLFYYYKIVHVVQNNEKKYTRQSQIKETCNKSKHTSISSQKINNVTWHNSSLDKMHPLYLSYQSLHAIKSYAGIWPRGHPYTMFFSNVSNLAIFSRNLPKLFFNIQQHSSGSPLLNRMISLQ